MRRCKVFLGCRVKTFSRLNSLKDPKREMFDCAIRKCKLPALQLSPLAMFHTKTRSGQATLLWASIRKALLKIVLEPRLISWTIIKGPCKTVVWMLEEISKNNISNWYARAWVTKRCSIWISLSVTKNFMC